MGFKIVWTDPAIEQLGEACTYISRGNPEAAQRVGDEIIRHVDVLADFPFIGPPFPRGSSGRVREIICGNYRIFYRVGRQRKLIEVLSVWHAARGTPQIGS